MPKYLPVWMDGLPPDIAKRAQIELGETEEKKIQCLEDLKRIIRAEKDLRARLDDAFLLRFLRVRKYNVKRAFNVLRNYYEFKMRYSRVVTDFKPSELVHVRVVNCMDLIPKRMENGSVLVVVRMGYFDLETGTPDEYLAACLMLAELAIIPEVSQICGGAVVVDFENISLSKLRRYASPKLVYRFVHLIQNCFPFRVTGFHVVNEPTYMNLLFNIIKQLISDKVKQKIHFHGKNIESFHKEVPPEVLPEELGGRLGPMNSRNIRQLLLENEAYFEEINSYGYQNHNEHISSRKRSS